MLYFIKLYSMMISVHTLLARFMGPTWGPSGADRTQVGPMLAPWTLLSGHAWWASRNFQLTLKLRMLYFVVKMKQQFNPSICSIKSLFYIYQIFKGYKKRLDRTFTQCYSSSLKIGHRGLEKKYGMSSWWKEFKDPLIVYFLNFFDKCSRLMHDVKLCVRITLKRHLNWIFALSIPILTYSEHLNQTVTDKNNKNTTKREIIVRYVEYDMISYQNSMQCVSWRNSENKVSHGRFIFPICPDTISNEYHSLNII